uniref:Putative ovule protein n=1 Tax=Solanum chacoense TaxID=4108 RepID=A0A0V0GQ04_SOLCH
MSTTCLIMIYCVESSRVCLIQNLTPYKVDRSIDQASERYVILCNEILYFCILLKKTSYFCCCGIN